MTKSEVKTLLLSFFSWRAILFVLLFLAIKFVPLQKSFLGGGMVRYLSAPWFWSWINFDGEHYLSLAYQGYLPLTYFYFPVYSLVTKFVASIFGGGFETIAKSGLIVSNFAFLAGLIFFWKLNIKDFGKKVATFSLILLLLFPTSFYFASFYTESLFFLLTVSSFYFARQKKWLLAGILGAVSTATRITGLALIPALFVELVLQRKEDKNMKICLPLFSLLLIPSGILAYMFYLYRTTGDPLIFYNTVTIFGQQRSGHLILLPQVFYRYFFKILPNLNYSYFPVVFTTFMEILSALAFLALSLVSFFKMRISYAFYILMSFLIPTFSGSFSSLPRYVVTIFPAFILGALLIKEQKKAIQLIVFLFFFLTLAISTAMFLRGYWLA